MPQSEVVNIDDEAQKEQERSSELTIVKLFGQIIMGNGQVMWIGLNGRDILIGTLNDQDVDSMETAGLLLDQTGKRKINTSDFGESDSPLGCVKYIFPLGLENQDAIVRTQYDQRGRTHEVVFTVTFPPSRESERYPFAGQRQEIRFSLGSILQLFSSGNIPMLSFSLTGERQARTCMLIPHTEVVTNGLGFAMFFNEPRGEAEIATGSEQLGSLTVAAQFIESIIHGTIETLSQRDQEKIMKILQKLRDLPNNDRGTRVVASITGHPVEEIRTLFELHKPKEEEDREHYFHEVMKELWVLLHLNEMPNEIVASLQGGYKKIVSKGLQQSPMLNAGQASSQASLLDSSNNGRLISGEQLLQLESGNMLPDGLIDEEGGEFYDIDKKLLNKKREMKRLNFSQIHDWMLRIQRIAYDDRKSFATKLRALNKLNAMRDYLSKNKKDVKNSVFMTSKNLEMRRITIGREIMLSFFRLKNTAIINNDEFFQQFYNESFIEENQDYVSQQVATEWVAKLVDNFEFQPLNDHLDQMKLCFNLLVRIESNTKIANYIQYGILFSTINIFAIKIGHIEHGDDYGKKPEWIGFGRENYDHNLHKEWKHVANLDYLDLDPNSIFYEIDRKMIDVKERGRIQLKKNFYFLKIWLQELVGVIKDKNDVKITYQVLRKILTYVKAQEMMQIKNDRYSEGYTYINQRPKNAFDIQGHNGFWYGKHEAIYTARAVFAKVMHSLVYPENLNGKSIHDMDDELRAVQDDEIKKILDEIFGVNSVNMLGNTDLFGFVDQIIGRVEIINGFEVELLLFLEKINIGYLPPKSIDANYYLLAFWLENVFRHKEYDKGEYNSKNQIELRAIISEVETRLNKKRNNILLTILNAFKEKMIKP